MKNATIIKTDLDAAYKLIVRSKDVKSLFIFLGAYLERIHEDEEFVELLNGKAESEKSATRNEHDLEASKLTSFWYPWEELEILWELHSSGHQIMHDMANDTITDPKGSTIIKDAKGLAMAGWFKEDLDKIFNEGTDKDNSQFKARDYRRHIDVIHLKMMRWLASASPQPLASVGLYVIKDDGQLYYDNKALNLAPQLKRLAIVLVVGHGKPVKRSEIIDALWSEEHGSKLLDNRNNTESKINKAISTKVSALNTELRKKSKKAPIVSAGATAYRFVP